MRKIYAAQLRNALNPSSASGHLASDLSDIARHDLERLISDWEVWARDDQLPPDALPSGEPWRVWLLLGGRGSGKTRAGAEWVRSIATSLRPCDVPAVTRPPGSARKAGRRAPPRIALVGKTMSDVRHVMVDGVSGLLAIHPAHERPVFEPSKRRITWPNGAVAELFSADETEA